MGAALASSTTSPKTHLAHQIRAARLAVGLSVQQFSKRARWSCDKTYRFEQGRQEPSALELATIMILTGKPFEFFIAVAERLAA